VSVLDPYLYASERIKARCVSRLLHRFSKPSPASQLRPEAVITMLVRTAVIALLASAVTLVKGQHHYGTGMCLLLFFGICLMLSVVTLYTPGLGVCGAYSSSTDYVVAVAKGTFDSYPYVTCFKQSSIVRELMFPLCLVALDPTQTRRSTLNQSTYHLTTL
jgi:hypothetical protein